MSGHARSVWNDNFLISMDFDFYQIDRNMLELPINGGILGRCGYMCPKIFNIFWNDKLGAFL